MAAVDLGEGLIGRPQHYQCRRYRVDHVVVSVDGPALEVFQVRAAGITVRLIQVGKTGLVHDHVAAVAAGHFAPHETAVRRLFRNTDVLGAGDGDVRYAVVGDVVDFRDLQVAVQREPIAGVVPRAGADVDPAVVYFDQPAQGVERHVARLGVRSGAGSRAAGRIGDYRMGQMDPLLPSQLQGIAAQQQAGELFGAERRIVADYRLSVATDVDDISVGRVGDDREVDRSLAAGQNPQRVARRNHYPIKLDRLIHVVDGHLRRIHLGPGRPPVAGAEHGGQLIERGRSGHLIEDAHVELAFRPHVHLDAVRGVHAVGIKMYVDLRQADLDPRQTRVGRLVDAVFASKAVGADHRRVEYVRVGRIGRQVIGDAAGQPGDGPGHVGNLGEGVAAVVATEDAHVAVQTRLGIVHCHQDRPLADGDADAIFPVQDAAAVDLRPGLAAVGRA